MDWRVIASPLLGLGILWCSRFWVKHLVNRIKSEKLPPPSKELEERWELLTVDPEGSGALLGDLERSLFFLAFWLTSWEVVAAWLAFKVAAKWEAWSTIGRLPESLPNTDPLAYLVARRRWASQRLMSFLVGTLANVLLAFISVLIGKNLLAWLCP